MRLEINEMGKPDQIYEIKDLVSIDFKYQEIRIVETNNPKEVTIIKVNKENNQLFFLWEK